ncbi:MAG: pathogenicity locus [Desulfovibrionaceae bacterium]|nr:pathogenicity locus [Desulfovibrionaceae bacterium]
MTGKAVALKRLRAIPGVGPRLAQVLFDLGYASVDDLAGQDPEAMYRQLTDKQGHVDRCVLYVFRCAVYYASNERHDPEKLHWWVWKE